MTNATMTQQEKETWAIDWGWRPCGPSEPGMWTRDDCDDDPPLCTLEEVLEEIESNRSVRDH